MDKSITEAKLDRMIEKAEKLKAILMDCENFVEAMDNVDSMATELKPQQNIIYTISLGDIKTIALADASLFAPEFLEQLNDMLPKIFVAKPKPKAKEIDLSKSGEYKSIKQDNIIIGKA